MANINIITKTQLSDSLSADILNSFTKRAVNVIHDGIKVAIVIDPVLTNYQDVQSIGGNPNKYLIDSDNLVDSETIVRLATFSLPNFKHSILFVFNSLNADRTENLSNFNIDNFQFSDEIVKESGCFIISYLKNRRCSIGDNFNLLLISGASGMGKTTLAHFIAKSIGSKVYHLAYSDIDGENTAAIAKNVSKFFAKINPNDFVIIDDADCALKGQNINHFVKNALVSQINKRGDIIFVIESTNPSEYGYEISKHVFRNLSIKNLNNTKRLVYLALFLSEGGIDLSDDLASKLSLTGFSIKDLKQVASFAKVFVLGGMPTHLAVSKACDTVHDSIINSTISSDSIFRATRPKYKLDKIILPKEKKDKIIYATKLISNIPVIYDKWNFSAIDPHPRSIINFFGEPGTGKSMSAHAIADILGKDLLALNYAEIESKYIGEAPKKLESAFTYAKQHDCVMFFDEADSFLGKRIEDVSHSADQALNSLRSTMLIQLEQFEGVVIFASNLRENYDKAFHSRFLYEIEFELPNDNCRVEIFKSFFREITPLQALLFSEDDFKKLADVTGGMSGRHIKSGILETLNKIASINADFPCTGALVTMLIETFTDKNENKLNVVVNKSDVSEDKKMIGNALAKEYAPTQSPTIDNSKYIPLINLAYYASFSDKVIDEQELSVILEAQRSLGVMMNEISSKQDLPDLNLIISEIKDVGLTNQAIELVARIVAADGQYTDEEQQFVNEFAESAGMQSSYVADLHALINHLSLENELLNKIFSEK